MLIIMNSDATEAQCAEVERVIASLGHESLPVAGASRTAICVVGNDGKVPRGVFAHLPGIKEIVQVTRPYKMVSREVRPDDTVIEVGDVAIGGDEPVILAGPCSVETEATTLEIARQAREAGARLFRAGAYKPRTSPYAFQGLGEEGLHTLAKVREEVGLPVVSEVVDTESLPLMLEHVDVLQVGARNMANYQLLKRLGKVDRPILLKRGLSATFDEWLMAAEYLLANGNEKVILCERGIRTFSQHARNTLDLNVVPLVRRLSHLPIIVDPSHGVGETSRVRPMSRAALAAGAQGLLLEAHVDPSRAYSDGQQTIPIETLAGIVRDAQHLQGLEQLE
ncbi:MAG: 3-deoxy-7-phosphoheptulonate synthase [Acidobacteriota bacterium]